MASLLPVTPSAGTNPSNAPIAAATDQATVAQNFTQFLQLLTTQLKNQNPMDPLDTNQFTQQLVQFAQVEQQMKQNDFDVVAVAVRGLSFYPGRSYGLGSEVLRFLKEAASRNNTIVDVMGNAYALKYACDAGTLVCGFEDNEWTNAAFMNWLCGKAAAPGSLPVTPPCLR